ncbi:hydrogenase maturation protease [Mycobacterium sp. Marseille-P9652]|uniref:hydrogenase maturation protease n=1 Tax=Mycobacterium sp. Marseille-P9652 TaxID=2654950 RepID=UPI0012E80BFF|nr:hydrogenase maturation protease [Mycobacterium sp. Marseille-P9652]
MTDRLKATVVVGLGNPYRRDDGVGPAVADAVDALGLADVVVVTGISDPMSLVEAWSGAGLAVVVDAAVGAPPAPGRVRRCALADLGAGRDGLSSHSVDVARAHELAQALGRAPGAVVVVTVEAADTGHGTGLTPAVARAVPEAVRLVRDEISCGRER